MNIKQLSRKYIFFIILFVLIIIISAFIIKPYVTAILTAIILAYVFHPFHKWLRSRVKNNALSASIVTLLVIIVFCLPFLFFINSIGTSIQTIRQIDLAREGTAVVQDCGSQSNALCSLVVTFFDLINTPGIESFISTLLSQANSAILKVSTGFIVSLPNRLLAIFVTFFIMYYLLKEGPKLIHWLKKSLPLEKKHQEHIIKEFSEVTYAVIYGTFLIALIQGLLAFAGFWVLGFRNPVFLGIATAFAALLPFIGTALIWIPASLVKIINGIILGENANIINGVLMIIYGFVVVSLIDNLLRPKLIGSRTTLHPVLILLGLLGGAALLGFIGIIIGPIILSLLIILMTIYFKTHGERT